MTDFSPDENTAMLAGGGAGKEYLDSLGHYQLDKLTPDQALTFLQVMFGRYHEALAEAEHRLTAPPA